jgi:hypothetical protein
MQDMARLLERLRQLLAGSPDLVEKRMFGGVCFMRGEHMLCCASKRGVLLRVGTEREPAILALAGVRPMEHGGRRMPGFVWADETALDDAALSYWLAEADAYVATLPPKAQPRTLRPRP